MQLKLLDEDNQKLVSQDKDLVKRKRQIKFCKELEKIDESDKELVLASRICSELNNSLVVYGDNIRVIIEIDGKEVAKVFFDDRFFAKRYEYSIKSWIGDYSQF